MLAVATAAAPDAGPPEIVAAQLASPQGIAEDAVALAFAGYDGSVFLIAK